MDLRCYEDEDSLIKLVDIDGNKEKIDKATKLRKLLADKKISPVVSNISDITNLAAFNVNSGKVWLIGRGDELDVYDDNKGVLDFWIYSPSGIEGYMSDILVNYRKDELSEHDIEYTECILGDADLKHKYFDDIHDSWRGI